jgi:hypothetical protein
MTGMSGGYVERASEGGRSSSERLQRQTVVGGVGEVGGALERQGGGGAGTPGKSPHE